MCLGNYQITLANYELLVLYRNVFAKYTMLMYLYKLTDAVMRKIECLVNLHLIHLACSCKISFYAWRQMVM